jgi:polysaccharide export outer membrane protein
MTHLLHMRTTLLAAALIAGLAGASLSAQGGRGAAAPPPGAAALPATAPVKATPGEYLIGVEDVLEILVWRTPELTRTVAVRPDGRISLPLLNDVSVVNLTPLQVRDQLLKGYAEFLTEAEISVIVQEIHSLKVSVLGLVNQPGRYELRSKATVLEALALAGGLAEFAKRDQITVFRPTDTGWKTFGFDYARLVSNLDIEQNFALGPGDIVIVP